MHMVQAQLAAPGEHERLSPSSSATFPRSLHRLLRLRDLLPGVPLQLGRDVLVDPLLVPPLHGQHRDAVEIDPAQPVRVAYLWLSKESALTGMISWNRSSDPGRLPHWCDPILGFPKTPWQWKPDSL